MLKIPDVKECNIRKLIRFIKFIHHMHHTQLSLSFAVYIACAGVGKRKHMFRKKFAVIYIYICQA